MSAAFHRRSFTTEQKHKHLWPSLFMLRTNFACHSCCLTLSWHDECLAVGVQHQGLQTAVLSNILCIDCHGILTMMSSCMRPIPSIWARTSVVGRSALALGIQPSTLWPPKGSHWPCSRHVAESVEPSISVFMSALCTPFLSSCA